MSVKSTAKRATSKSGRGRRGKVKPYTMAQVATMRIEAILFLIALVVLLVCTAATP